MKRLLYLFFALSIVLTSCKEKETPIVETPASPTSTVTIAGKSYATVTIGTLEWTSVNYDGSAGFYYGGGVTGGQPNHGKLVTKNEALAIAGSLPTGWRLPTLDDYVNLVNQAGGFKIFKGVDNFTNIIGSDLNDAAAKKLITDTKFGFNALLVGYHNGTAYAEQGIETSIWSTAVPLAAATTYAPMLLNIGGSGTTYFGGFSETAQPVTPASADTRGKGSLRFVRTK